MLAELILSNSVLGEMRTTIFRVFEQMFKSTKSKQKFIATPDFVSVFVRTAQENLKPSRDILKFRFSVLTLFLFIRENRNYVPGETLKNQKLRKRLFNKGIFYLIFECLQYPHKDKELTDNVVLTELPTEDYEHQLSILRNKFGNDFIFTELEKEINAISHKIRECEKRKPKRMLKKFESAPSSPKRSLSPLKELDSSFSHVDQQIDFEIELKSTYKLKLHSNVDKFLMFLINILTQRYLKALSKMLDEEKAFNEVCQINQI
jgi:hypothetical protein